MHHKKINMRNVVTGNLDAGVIIFVTLATLMFLPEVVKSQSEPEIPYKIPVVVVKFFPVKNDSIDIGVTGDWGKSLVFTQEKTTRITKQLVDVLEQSSRYHAYKDSLARPSLDYKILETYTFMEPLPTVSNSERNHAPMTDYDAIMQMISIDDWINNHGVKEVWIWAYHGGKVNLWESNMSSPHGDVSNSNRDENDLPVFDQSYTVYHYNYQRGLSEAVENHMHQIEALLNHIDGRDEAPKSEWDELLFWGKFVGSDYSHKIIEPRCGWAHYPPNGKHDYDWANKKYVYSDIEDWKPDGSGTKQRLNCERWNCNSLDWFRFWMQSIPGYKNNLNYNGKKLTNWWLFVGAWDYAKKNNIHLVSDHK